MKKFALALVTSAALLSVSTISAFAVDLPKLPGAGGFALGGNGGVALITANLKDGANLKVTANALTGGDGGNALSAAIDKDAFSAALGGDGGAAGVDMTMGSSAKATLNVKALDAGWGGNAVALMGKKKLEVKLPGIASALLK